MSAPVQTSYRTHELYLASGCARPEAEAGVGRHGTISSRATPLSVNANCNVSWFHCSGWRRLFSATVRLLPSLSGMHPVSDVAGHRRKVLFFGPGDAISDLILGRNFSIEWASFTTSLCSRSWGYAAWFRTHWMSKSAGAFYK